MHGTGESERSPGHTWSADSGQRYKRRVQLDAVSQDDQCESDHLTVTCDNNYQ